MSRFRVLGPLKAEPGTPSAAKPRVVLGLLLVAAIDELWGDNPPRTARSTLYVYISKLRKILSADGSDGVGLIESSLPGYLIKVAPGELDMHDFEELVRRGRGHYQQRDFAAAARELRAALDLWTGPALSGLPRGPRLEDAASHLEMTRTEALEQRISADLWAGRDSRLIGELAGLARAHPLRETLHAHLIVALYRADRRAEALHAYDTLRRSLAGELGLDPGPGHILRNLPIGSASELAAAAVTAFERGQRRLVYPRKLVIALYLPMLVRRKAARTVARAGADIDRKDDRVIRSGSLGDDLARQARADWAARSAS
jgi:DNA-binding SARP family transcriptional activator